MSEYPPQDDQNIAAEMDRWIAAEGEPTPKEAKEKMRETVLSFDQLDELPQAPLAEDLAKSAEGIFKNEELDPNDPGAIIHRGAQAARAQIETDFAKIHADADAAMRGVKEQVANLPTSLPPEPPAFDTGKAVPAEVPMGENLKAKAERFNEANASAHIPVADKGIVKQLEERQARERVEAAKAVGEGLAGMKLEYLAKKNSALDKKAGKLGVGPLIKGIGREFAGFGKDVGAAARGAWWAGTHPIEAMRRGGHATLSGLEAMGRYGKYFFEKDVSFKEKSAKLGADVAKLVESYNQMPFHRKAEISAVLLGASALTGALGLTGTAGMLGKAFIVQRGLASAGVGIKVGRSKRLEKSSKATKIALGSAAGIGYGVATWFLGNALRDELQSWLSGLFHGSGPDHELLSRAPAAPAEVGPRQIPFHFDNSDVAQMGHIDVGEHAASAAAPHAAPAAGAAHPAPHHAGHHPVRRGAHHRAPAHHHRVPGAEALRRDELETRFLNEWQLLHNGTPDAPAAMPTQAQIDDYINTHLHAQAAHIHNLNIHRARLGLKPVPFEQAAPAAGPAVEVPPQAPPPSPEMSHIGGQDLHYHEDAITVPTNPPVEQAVPVPQAAPSAPAIPTPLEQMPPAHEVPPAPPAERVITVPTNAPAPAPAPEQLASIPPAHEVPVPQAEHLQNAPSGLPQTPAETIAFANAHSGEPHIYAAQDGKHLFVWGDTPANQRLAVGQYFARPEVKAGTVVYGTDDLGQKMVPYVKGADGSTAIAAEPTRTSGFLGFFSSLAKAPDPTHEDFGSVLQ